MVDGLALCSCACVTCLWCSLLALCFPKFLKKLQESDSDACCTVCPKKTTGVKTECGNTRIKRLNRMIDKCKSSVNNCDEKKTRTRMNSVPIRYREPAKCTVKIVRKSRPRPQCRRNESSGPGEADRGLFLPPENEAHCQRIDHSFTDNSPVHTELFYPRRKEQQKRLQRVRVKDESNDFEGENRPDEIDQKIYSDENILADIADGVRPEIQTEARRISYRKIEDPFVAGKYPTPIVDGFRNVVRR